MTVRFRVVALFVMLLGSGAIAAGTDPSAPRTPQDVIGALKAGTGLSSEWSSPGQALHPTA